MEKHFHVDHERRTCVTAYPNLVTKSQRYAKSRDFYEKQIKYLSLKTKCCRAAKTTWSELLTCSTVILWYISSKNIQVVMLPPKGHEANPTESFQAIILCNRMWGNDKLLGEEQRNKVQQLFERPKYQCLKFLVDCALCFNTAAFRGWCEARTTGRHLQNKWRTDLVARSWV